MAKLQNPIITHNGVACVPCTEGDTWHANNVHRVANKAVNGWQQCPPQCGHPLAFQPVGRTFIDELGRRSS